MVKWWIFNEKCVRDGQITENKKVSNASKSTFEVRLVAKACKRRSVLSQCVINGAIILLGTAIGMPIGFSAVLLPQLRAPNSTLVTDDDWASWIASVHSIVTPIGSILAGPMMDHWGRRRTLQASVVPLILGWLMMSVAPSLIILCVGRMLAGFAVGMVSGPSYVLIGEVSEPKLRGLFSSAQSAAYSLGILLVYALGSLLPWRLVAAIATTLPMSCFLVFIFLPESPVHLVRKKRIEEARKALVWLRGGNCFKANSELHNLIVHSKIEDQSQTTTSRWNIIARPEVYKPFSIIFTFCLLQILSGSYIVIFYGVSLIAKASGGKETDIDSLAIAVMSALVRFVVSIITSVCLLRIGRRRVGMISAGGTTLACFSIVLFLQLRQNSSFDTAIVGSLIMVYVALNTFGIFSLPCMMIGEVLPADVRGFVSGILLTLINLTIFTTIKLYPYTESVLGSEGVFFTFAIISIITTLYIYLFLPETKNRPLTQIETYFACGKNYLWLTRDKVLIARKPSIVTIT